jgi:hypothetical protein
MKTQPGVAARDLARNRATRPGPEDPLGLAAGLLRGLTPSRRPKQVRDSEGPGTRPVTRRTAPDTVMHIMIMFLRVRAR